MASNSSEIAEKFNDYFSNIASDLKAKIEIQDDDRSYEAFLNDPVPLSIFIRPASNSEIYDIVKKLKNKSTKDTKISTLKLASEDVKFVYALTGTISQSLEEGECSHRHLKLLELSLYTKTVQKQQSLIIAQSHYWQLFPKFTKKLCLPDL